MNGVDAKKSKSKDGRWPSRRTIAVPSTSVNSSGVSDNSGHKRCWAGGRISRRGWNVTDEFAAGSRGFIVSHYTRLSMDFGHQSELTRNMWFLRFPPMERPIERGLLSLSPPPSSPLTHTVHSLN